MVFEKKKGGEVKSLRQRKFDFLLLTLVLLLGLYLRLFVVPATQIDTPFRADARQYTDYAYNIRLHGIYSNNLDAVKNTDTTLTPDAVRSPGYPFSSTRLPYPKNWIDLQSMFSFWIG